MHSRALLLFVFFLYLQLTAIAGKVKPHHYADSLEVKLILVEDNIKVNILNDLAEHYLRNFPNKSLDRSQNALDLAIQLKDKKNQSRALRNIGVSLQHLVAKYDSALIYCLDALKISEPNELYTETILNHIAIANIYSEVGNYSRSIDYLTRAELVTSTITDYHDAVEIKILKSKSFLNIELYNESIEELKAGLKLCKLHSMALEEAYVRLAMTEHYLAIANENLAFEHIKTSMKIMNEVGDASDIADALLVFAKFHQQFNRPQEALTALNKNLELREYLGDLKGKSECLFYLGLNYNKIGNYEKAINYLNQSERIAEQINFKRILRRCYNQLYYAYSNLGNYEKTVEFRNLYVSITELIFAEESERQIAEQQAKFDIEQKDKEILIQKERLDLRNSQIERQRRFNIAITIIAILLLALGGLLFYNYRNKQKINLQLENQNTTITHQNEKLQDLNNTKDKFFSIIGHDLKGPLNSLTSFLNLLKNHTSSLSEVEIKNLANELDKSIKNLHSLLENLLTWARSQTDNIDLSPEQLNVYQLIEENIDLLQNQANNKDIDLRYEGNKNVMAIADKNSISTVIRNLMSNAIKFTHPHGTIQISTEEWKDAVEVSIKDNGVGMPKEVLDKLFTIGSKHSTLGTNKEKGTGLGLILCKEFVEKNNGKIMVASTPGAGSKFSFSLPKN